MGLIDDQYTRRPFYGSRRMVVYLQEQGHAVNRKRVQRLMRVLGLAGMAPGPNTSRPHPEHKVYPYLLRGVAVMRPNQVWSTDITYIRLAHGFAYLVAIIDWYSRGCWPGGSPTPWRRGSAWTAWRTPCAPMAGPRCSTATKGRSSPARPSPGCCLDAGIAISMDGRGRALDNIFVERLWRSVKYEDVYLKGYASLPELLLGLTEYFAFYNGERPHQSLGYRTPDAVYRSGEGGGASIVDRFGGTPEPTATVPVPSGRGLPPTGGLRAVPADSVWTKRECRVATVWTSRGQRAGGALPPPCPHSFTLCPHCAAPAPVRAEDACGATTTEFLIIIAAQALLSEGLRRNLGQRQTAAIEEGGASLNSGGNCPGHGVHFMARRVGGHRRAVPTRDRFGQGVYLDRGVLEGEGRSDEVSQEHGGERLDKSTRQHQRLSIGSAQAGLGVRGSAAKPPSVIRRRQVPVRRRRAVGHRGTSGCRYLLTCAGWSPGRDAPECPV